MADAGGEGSGTVEAVPTHLHQGMMASGAWQQYKPGPTAPAHDAGASTTVKQDLAAERAWKRGNAAKALLLWDSILEGTNRFGEAERRRLESNRVHAINALDAENRFARYPFDVVESICEVQAARRAAAADGKAREGGGGGGGGEKSGVTVVILSCKRYHLFTRTVNSFLWACTDIDLVTRWICIDDGSHPTERACMQALYPFFEFVWRSADDPDVAGRDVQSHARSLNVARSMVDTPWVLPLEDDWLFVTRAPLISRCMAVLERERAAGVMQVFFNRHYIEDLSPAYLSVTGGARKRDAHGRTYVLHEFVPRGTPAYEAYCRAHPVNFAHQPHYSCRPCLMRADVWRVVGPYREWGKRGAAQSLLPFEDEYAHRYAAAGFRSAFLDAVPCIHIGRVNRDRDNPDAPPNAYQLNGEPQYGADCIPVPGAKGRKGEGSLGTAAAQGEGEAASEDGPGPDAAPAPHPAGKRLALTVTTCRRLAAFMRSMTSTLAMCKDVAHVDRFVVVDDNSSEEDRAAMRARFPFFEFIMKGPERRGHPASMNILLDATADCSHVLHTEDDWDFGTPFSVVDAVALVDALGLGQAVLRWHGGGGAPANAKCRVESPTTGAKRDIAYLPYRHDPHAPGTPPAFAVHRKVLLDRLDVDEAAVVAASGGSNATAGGRWWPSLTLNPAVWNMKVLRATGERFDEAVDHSVFEYDMAVRLWVKGFRVATFDADITQLPGMAAYTLNGTARFYDAVGCANHRPSGGDPQCPYCIAQKARCAASAGKSTLPSSDAA
jgi:hypothetical protein